MIRQVGSAAARAGYRWCAALALAMAGCNGASSPESTSTPQVAVVLWAAAAEFPLAPVVAAYRKESGVPIEIVHGGDSPPARTDLVLTADTGALWAMAEQSGLRPVYSNALEANVPAALRDPDGMWFGVSWRPLVIVYDPREVPEEAALPGYAALAEERWRGRLCLSTSRLAANRLLLAALIAELGEQAAEDAVRGWVANLAVTPLASGRELLAAIAEDRCDIGIVDAGVIAAAPEQSAVALSAPRALFAVVTAAGATRHATNPDGAAALLEWLSAEAAQAIVAAESSALPVHPRVAASPRMHGTFPPGPVQVAQAASRLGAAALLAERAGYD